MYFAFELDLIKDKDVISPETIFENTSFSPYCPTPKLYMRIGYSKDFKNSIDVENRIQNIVRYLENTLPEDIYYSLSNRNRNRFVIQCPNEAFAKVIAGNIQILSNKYMPGIMYGKKDYYKYSEDKYPAVLGIPSNFLLSSVFPYVIELLLEVERRFNYKDEKDLKRMNSYLKEEMIKLAKRDRIDNRYFGKKLIEPKAYSINVKPFPLTKTEEFQRVTERLNKIPYYRRKYFIAINVSNKVSEPHSVFDGPDMFFPKKYEPANPTKRHILITQYGLYPITPGVFFVYIPKKASLSEKIDMMIDFIDKVEDTVKQRKEVETFLTLEDKVFEEYPQKYLVPLSV
ncbi:MAG TPA: hypothetical protein ENO30_02100 [Thermodesulfobium narugense]|nr:hypothetical protein [Thermodesulfobium narugense]